MLRDGNSRLHTSLSGRNSAMLNQSSIIYWYNHWLSRCQLCDLWYVQAFMQPIKPTKPTSSSTLLTQNVIRWHAPIQWFWFLCPLTSLSRAAASSSCQLLLHGLFAFVPLLSWFSSVLLMLQQMLHSTCTCADEYRRESCWQAGGVRAVKSMWQRK